MELSIDFGKILWAALDQVNGGGRRAKAHSGGWTSTA